VKFICNLNYNGLISDLQFIIVTFIMFNLYSGRHYYDSNPLQSFDCILRSPTGLNIEGQTDN